MRRLAALSLLVGGTLLSASCTPYLSHARVLRANYNVSRGEFQSAIVDYLRAADDQRFAAWVAYNLGNVYHFLGESDAALERWDRAGQAGDRDLLFGSAFNRGVLLFEQGDYPAALEAFRSALVVNPTSRAAKVNMELTLERLAADAGLEERSAAATERSAESGTGEGASRILDYIRRREEQRWRANADSDIRPEARDW